MNNETLSQILGEMAYAAKSDVAMLYHDFSREQISEAEEKLDKLIEHDTPKKVLNQHYEYDDSEVIFIDASCPSCGDDVFDCALFCKCGQRLDWSE